LRSKTTPEFWQHYYRLPERAQRLADKCYRIWLSNPNHRSIHFKRLEGHPSLYSARVGIHYRAIAQREADLMIWVWIGHHSDYDSLLKSRRK
jgi:mRNA-degrading endonuclease RelE of RelBE toxin-antitoxin system